MAIPTLDIMKGWVEDLSAKNRALEEENKTLKCKIVTLTQELEMERMANGNTSVNVQTQVEEVSRSPGPSRKVHSQSNVNIISEQQIPRATTSTTGIGSQTSEANPGRRPRKRRKVESVTEVCSDKNMSGVGEGIDHPCVVESNPFKIEKILGIVLSKLGKNDLLNARRISHAWNVESLKVLRKSKFTQMLRGSRIKEYIHFSRSTEPRPFIIPFHLDFDISLSMSTFGLNNRILTTDVDSLCEIFGPQCVSTLSLTVNDNDYNEENIKKMGVIECLALFSPGLKTLDFTHFDSGIHILKNKKITFPYLRKFICNTNKCESGSTGQRLTYISIIENCPSLEDLSLTNPCDLDTWPLNFNQLKSLSLDSMIKPQNILDKILSSPGPPVLRELTIGLGYRELWTTEDRIVVHNILESVSSTLKSLTFRGVFFPLIDGNLRFPKLPQLEHFGLEYDIGEIRRQDAENIGFNQEKFPSLKSIELPLGFIFTPSPVQSEENEGFRIEFPNLFKLILRVSATAGPDNVNEPLEYLQQIFPTPSKLSLVNHGGNDFVKYVSYRILKSNWYKNIQQIEMIGFSRKDLGGIFDDLEFSPLVDLEKWHIYERVKESLKTEYQNSINRIKLEFEVTVAGAPCTIILRRKNQSVGLSN